MTATVLPTRCVEKPWGRREPWSGFSNPDPEGAAIGEIWFEAPDCDGAELLVKYVFTSERLSVQVHPDDRAARAAGHPRGKDEAWFILASDPGAVIALGTKRPLDANTLRKAAIDGSIEHLLVWHPVKPGDVLYVPAGTIHAIGAGITLVEVQQNVDLTYRLYDYGRPRELHLDEGIAVCRPEPYVVHNAPVEQSDYRTILFEGPKFVLERWAIDGSKKSLPAIEAGWLIPISGDGFVDGQALPVGCCAMLSGETEISANGAGQFLFAYPGERRVQDKCE